ncbi:hypothetical protein MTBPR1_80140 [Candidatus Terasakiella magnetica]|uniref:Uncharacterized protein n=1 Tax=Candidatus Terasakiella magnetica TaxID=1867952 RepID=A0A1C3RLC7_9PROT|nr:hypothetical protein [Candidatus Terasakiella magnetica]SCA58086.1 hypothetical protein MTBPR1_80140 [Candidatus Terasakiella magnetica]
MKDKIFFREAVAAMEEALASGALSGLDNAENFIGNYKYVGTHPERGDIFQHRQTQAFLVAERVT